MGAMSAPNVSRAFAALRWQPGGAIGSVVRARALSGTSGRVPCYVLVAILVMFVLVGTCAVPVCALLCAMLSLWLCFV